jgi:hypothetical protein
MEGHAVWVQDHHLVMEANGRKFLSDSDPRRIGETPPTPEGYFTAALAGIILHSVASAIRGHRHEPRGLKVTVRAHYVEAPARVEWAEVELPAGTSDMLQAAARRAVEDNPFLRLFQRPEPVEVVYHLSVKV